MKDHGPETDLTLVARQMKLRAFYAACPPISLFHERFSDKVAENLAKRAPLELNKDDLNESLLKGANDILRRQATELVDRTRRDALEAVATAEITEVAKEVVNGAIVMASIFGIDKENPDFYDILGITPGFIDLGIFSPSAQERKQIERFFYFFQEQDLTLTRQSAEEAARNRDWERIEQNRLAHEKALANLCRHREQFRELYGEELLSATTPMGE